MRKNILLALITIASVFVFTSASANSFATDEVSDFGIGNIIFISQNCQNLSGTELVNCAVEVIDQRGELRFHKTSSASAQLTETQTYNYEKCVEKGPSSDQEVYLDFVINCFNTASGTSI